MLWQFWQAWERLTSGLRSQCPGDAHETVEAWRAALRNSGGPGALIFSRQTLPLLSADDGAQARGLQRSAYILWQSGAGQPQVILIGSGSETQFALTAGKTLATEGIRARVVSMPSWELFDRQPDDYRESVLPSAVRARVAVEAAIKLGWERYGGLDGAVVGMAGFGASAPASVLYQKFGITTEAVVASAQKLLAKA
ncbi:MAG: hypothetical protein HY328_15080 [Chloroflexi bacterium]|nr:hypothetical protein [Chloroflexota bacterium]